MYVMCSTHVLQITLYSKFIEHKIITCKLHVKNTLTYLDMLQESTGIWYVQKSSH